MPKKTWKIHLLDSTDSAKGKSEEEEGPGKSEEEEGGQR
jgi:hypothetical protein